MSIDVLLNTIKDIVQPGKGILAADESHRTVGKRFEAVGVENTEANRLAYREMLFTAPNVGQYLSGVILFEETLMQKASCGTPIPELLAKQGIVPGIKVDKGLIELINADDEQTTQGLDGLPERLAEYRKLGARFAKWRSVYRISDDTPSMQAIHTNAEGLARYATACQQAGIVPIVEPEILIDGDHTLERCARVSDRVLFHTFRFLHLHKVHLEGMILKPSMVISGKQCAKQASHEEVANETLSVFRRTVPAAVPTINFLSGGQTPEQATAHLNLMNQAAHKPWNLSFSYARALQEPAMDAWRGKAENVQAAQAAFLKRLELNSKAQLGQYSTDME
ncbi:MAG: fructose-bisphosphate aldolase class I [Gammaproteobacteria bacterium CG11_big_fil_rev_8_21_14_0_20_46_22]|nr:MAG: fructose-bisphosphate aldolase class I [Gammaproteobacteria bacterium CG12_big_fil_rev_8_21_14_0_65_46_12]PIR10660.1 MAG: fructose-bisphosphate aldolase class I [Gammaproteobacteria bacterium CG11_big_fil_rev_8_21_14_0_20_46_22]